MKRVPDEQCAAICGLFCGACPAFPEECHGCMSDYVRDVCQECKNGFRDCIKLHNVNRCYECSQFPCDRLNTFSQGPIINGICNHANVIPDSRRMKEIGPIRWIEEQIVRHTCPKCGKLITWFDMASHSCK